MGRLDIFIPVTAKRVETLIIRQQEDQIGSLIALSEGTREGESENHR